ncbi:MAG: nuclear transport factor 2 family protein [Thiohalomonadales bacterium]
MKKDFVNKFALEWVEAWNKHDLDKIMNHYADNFEMSSPVIKIIMNEDSGILKGKKTIRAYWEKALKLNPDIYFELIKSYSGANSIVIQYKGHRGLSAETFFFNSEGKVKSAHAHYEE